MPVTLSMTAANKSGIDIAGALFVHLEGVSPEGYPISSATMVYVSPLADGVYLSLECMLDLGFLQPGSPFYPSELRNQDPLSHPRLSSADASLHGSDNCSEVCSCPKRSSVPSVPDKLPFEALPENNYKMRDWLLGTFNSSTFNT